MSRALERLLILHEDHEQNASTSTVRLVGSTGANQFSSISAGINALYGPLHGGANEAVLEMLARIRDSGESVQRFVERVKNKEDGVKLMGFGHRVYKNYDPRAKLVKESADEVLVELGVHDPLLDLAKELEELALEDDYFKERRLYPNVDFYTGRDLQGDGLPDAHVHRPVRDRASAWMARALARDAGRPADQDRPPSAAVRRRASAQLSGYTLIEPAARGGRHRRVTARGAGRPPSCCPSPLRGRRSSRRPSPACACSWSCRRAPPSGAARPLSNSREHVRSCRAAGVRSRPMAGAAG